MGNFDIFFTYFIGIICVLGISSVAAIFSERVGIINLGVNGMICLGATGYVLFSYIFTNKGEVVGNMWLQIPLLIFSMLFGLLGALLFGLATIRLKSNQIVSGVAINILAPAITLIILSVFGNANKMPSSVTELAVAGVAASYNSLNIFSLKVLLLIIVLVVSFVALNKTKWGLRLRSVGENPSAADAAGINVNKIKWTGVIISGILAGLAGGIFVFIKSGIAQNSFNGIVNGYGYLAIAIMIMGKWRVGLSSLSAIIFSIIFAFSFALPNLLPVDAKIYQPLFFALPYIMTLLILIIFSKKSFAPKALGVPYDKSQR